MIILGIDPGTQITGYGVIARDGSTYRHIDNGCIIPSPKESMDRRLSYIFNKVQDLIEEFRPEAIALEKVFFAKNAASALKLGQCRGAIMTLAGLKSLPLIEYSPNEIKQAVTGSGRAGKDQIKKMIRLLLSLPEDPHEDASDALAVAICHAQSYAFSKQLQTL